MQLDNLQRFLRHYDERFFSKAINKTAYADSLADAISLLKEEQKPASVVWKFGFPHCPDCGQMLPEGDRVKYCLHCGRPVTLG